MELQHIREIGLTSAYLSSHQTAGERTFSHCIGLCTPSCVNSGVSRNVTWNKVILPACLQKMHVSGKKNIQKRVWDGNPTLRNFTSFTEAFWMTPMIHQMRRNLQICLKVCFSWDPVSDGGYTGRHLIFSELRWRTRSWERGKKLWIQCLWHTADLIPCLTNLLFFLLRHILAKSVAYSCLQV